MGGMWPGRRMHGLVREINRSAQTAGLEETVHTLNAAKPRLFDILHGSLRNTVAAKALTLKLLNLCLARHHFLARDAALLSLPFGLVVDTSNACNLACPGCVHSARAKKLKLFDWEPGLIAEKCFTAFLRRYGASAIHATLCNYGEPLVNPETPKYIRASKRYLLHTTISTNMTVPRFDASAYVESGLDYMIVSIDGATQPVYERFRRKGDLGQAFENIGKLIAARERLGRRTPILAWRFLAFEHNVHEIPAAMEKARELGIDQFRADPAWTIDWDDPVIRPAPIRPIRVNFRPQLTDSLAGNWNPFPHELEEDSIEQDYGRTWSAEAESDRAPSSGPASSRPTSSGESCEWLYKSITMDAGARILPCCCAPTSRKDLHFATFDSANPAGSFNDDSFNSEKHRMARKFFADPARYRAQREEGGIYAGRIDANPYCSRCEWDKSGDPNPEHLHLYLRAAAADLFPDRTLALLAW